MSTGTRNITTGATAWEEVVEYLSDADDRVYQRTSVRVLTGVRVDEYGTATEVQSKTTQTHRYVRDGAAVYADLNGSSTPMSWSVRGGPDGVVLGRVDLNGGRYFYSMDTLGTMLSAYWDEVTALAAVKVVAYDRSSVQKRVRSEDEAAWHDRVEYAGLEYDPTTKMVSDTSRWFDPKTGRYTVQTGPGLWVLPLMDKENRHVSMGGRNRVRDRPTPRDPEGIGRRVGLRRSAGHGKATRSQCGVRLQHGTECLANPRHERRAAQDVVDGYGSGIGQVRRNADGQVHLVDHDELQHGLLQECGRKGVQATPHEGGVAGYEGADYPTAKPAANTKNASTNRVNIGVPPPMIGTDRAADHECGSPGHGCKSARADALPRARGRPDAST